MLVKRIIPCLDVSRGKTVKGINFVNLKDAGDPVELGRKYAEEGADELVYLDIKATLEGRPAFMELIEKVAKQINIPFTVGGGVRNVDDVERLLNSGADKVTVNSAAVRDPELISRLSGRFGSQCIVVAVDTKIVGGIDTVFVSGGTGLTNRKTLDWVREAEKRGAGEILLTSMDRDGTGTGYDINLTKKVSASLSIPVIASGGGGRKKDFLEVFCEGSADAALAAGIFHFNQETIYCLKDFLFGKGIPVRRDNEY